MVVPNRVHGQVLPDTLMSMVLGKPDDQTGWACPRDQDTHTARTK